MNNRMSTTKQEKYFSILIVSLFICTTLTLAAQKKGGAPGPPCIFAQDKGKFTIQLEGHTVGHEEFEIAPAGGGWSAKGTTDIKAPDSTATQITGNLTLQPDGAPISYEWISVAVLDNNLYYQYAVLARVYDWAKGGSQNFPVLIPQELTPGTISIESAGSPSVGGKSYEGLRVVTSDLEVLLYLDSNHRLMRMEVPASRVSITRD
jgi:hypothetical protein